MPRKSAEHVVGVLVSKLPESDQSCRLWWANASNGLTSLWHYWEMEKYRR